MEDTYLLSILGVLNPKTPSEEAKTFSFDHSYWSHTGVRTLKPSTANATSVHVLNHAAG